MIKLALFRFAPWNNELRNFVAVPFEGALNPFLYSPANTRLLSVKSFPHNMWIFPLILIPLWNLDFFFIDNLSHRELISEYFQYRSFVYLG